MQCVSRHQVVDLGNHRSQDIWTILVLKKQEFAVWTETAVQARWLRHSLYKPLSSWVRLVVVYFLDFRCIFPSSFSHFYYTTFQWTISNYDVFWFCSALFASIYLHTFLSPHSRFPCLLPFRYLGVCFYQPFPFMSLRVTSQLQYTALWFLKKKNLLRWQIIILPKHQFEM